jgi:hypothetical protein
MGCVLRVWGKNFDVHAFLRGSSLEPLTVWHIGEPQAPMSNPKGRQHQDSGMNVSVSVREFSELAGQVNDAISFLQAHHDELLRLRDFPCKEGTSLDFPVEDRDVACQMDTFPSELLALMGGLKITLVISRYPNSTKHLSS